MSADHSKSTTVHPADQLLILRIRQEALRFRELILRIRQEDSRFRELILRIRQEDASFRELGTKSISRLRSCTILNTPSAGIDADIVDYED
jgi:hypothetical protein